MEDIRTKEKIVEDIIDYLENNEDEAITIIEELDSYNGYLGDDRYCDMEELNDLFNGLDVLEIIERAYYGHDEDTYTTDSSGRIEYGEFNPNRDYFKFNGYGNLVSTDYKDYSAYIDEYLVDDLLENREYIDELTNIDELKELFDELESGDF